VPSLCLESFEEGLEYVLPVIRVLNDGPVLEDLPGEVSILSVLSPVPWVKVYVRLDFHLRAQAPEGLGVKARADVEEQALGVSALPQASRCPSSSAMACSISNWLWGTLGLVVHMPPLLQTGLAAVPCTEERLSRLRWLLSKPVQMLLGLPSADHLFNGGTLPANQAPTRKELFCRKPPPLAARLEPSREWPK
jgi:hypothetical protein